MHLALLVPGPIAAISGGYGYDRRITAELRAAGHTVDIVDAGQGGVTGVEHSSCAVLSQR